MSARVGSAFWDLRAGSTNLGRDIDKAMRMAQKRLTAAGRIIGKAVAAGMTVATGALTVATVKGINAIDQLAKEADKLGVATENLQLLRHAADLTGVSSEKLGTGLQRMTRRVAEAAQGTGEAVKALQELNLDARELNDLAPDEIFKRLMVAMQGVSNQSDRIRLAMKLFDSEGVGLVNTLKLTESQLDSMKRELESLGAIVTREAAAQVEDAKDQFTRLGVVAEGLTNQLTIGLAPVITVITDRIIELAKQSSFLRDKLNAIPEVIVDWITTFEKLPFVLSAVRTEMKKLEVGFKTLFGKSSDQEYESLKSLEAKTDAMFYESVFNSFREQVKRARKRAADRVAGMKDPLDANAEAVGGFTAELQRYLDVLNASSDPMARYKRRLKEIQEAIDKGVLEPSKELTETIVELRQKILENEPVVEEAARRMTEHWASFANNSLRAIDEFVETGRLRMKDFVRDVLQDLAKIEMRKLLFGSGDFLSGGIIGGIASGIGLRTTASVPGNALGGHVAAGQPTFVGERGVELFQPDVSGTIVPNVPTQGLINGMGGDVFNISNYISAGVTQEGFAKGMQESERRIVNAILTAKKNGGLFGDTFATS